MLALGGEHTITYGLTMGLAENPADVTVVQIDAHADLADTLDGRHWSHGTVMRRIWERGCRLVQIGIRSLSRKEFEFAATSPRIATYYAHQLDRQWPEILQSLRSLEGKVYLTLDVNGLDPPSCQVREPHSQGGCRGGERSRLFGCLRPSRGRICCGADIVEFVPSSVTPGCDPVAARLVTKTLAWWWCGLRQRASG